jgi:hypothetical protein
MHLSGMIINKINLHAPGTHAIKKSLPQALIEKMKLI